MGWMRCDPRARARCPDRETCELDAVFSGGSECDAFNYRCTEQPPTIADHIRCLPDEELAKIIMCPYDNDHNNCIPGSNCLDCCLKWLQQPYESEGTP